MTIMNVVKTLSRNEMKNIMAGAGFQGCEFYCCNTQTNVCGDKQEAIPTSNEENCESHEQCQSDYVNQMGEGRCGEGYYVGALCTV